MPGEVSALPDTSELASSAGPGVLRERFVLAERLDHGRFGTMYKARDRQRERYGRPYVAVLIVPPEVVRSPEQLDAFRRQLAVVRTLSHRNIVAVDGLDRDGDLHFVVLEWVDGESLRNVIDSLAPEKVCERDTLGVVRAVGAALACGHARGVVHGDVRPENVLVTASGDVKLLYTSACLVASSPFPVGSADDVRGLAALAYELLSGRPPPAAAAYGGQARAVPKRIEGLSRKRWRALRAALTARDARVGSVRQLLAGLGLGAAVQEKGRRGDRAGRRRAWPRRRLTIAAVLGLGCVALAAGLVQLRERPAALPEQLAGVPASLAGNVADAAAGARRAAAGLRDRVQPARERLLAWWDAASAGDGGVRPDSENAPVPPPAAEAGIDSADDAPGAGREGSSEGQSRPGAASGRPAAGSERPDREPPRAALEEPSNRARGADARSASPGTGAAAGTAPAPSARAAGAASGGARNVGSSQLRFARAQVTVSESRGVAAVEVRRQTDRGEASFVWWTRDGSAAAGDDYADLGRAVERFEDGEVSRTLYVPIVSDAITENVEYFEVLMGPLSSDGNQNGALRSARVTILDDDS